MRNCRLCAVYSHGLREHFLADRVAENILADVGEAAHGTHTSAQGGGRICEMEKGDETGEERGYTDSVVGSFSDRLRQRLCALRGRTDRGAGLETPRRCFRPVGSAARGRNFARPRFHGRPAKKGGSEGSRRKCERLHVRPGRVPGGVCAAARWPSVIGGAAGSDGGLRGETRRDSMIVLWWLCSGLFVGVRWLWDRCNTSGLFEPDPRRFSNIQ